MKFRLSSTVVFSSIAGYILGSDNPDLKNIILLSTGGILITGCANAFNQILEKPYDKMMERTKKRPLPCDNLTLYESNIFATILLVLGVFFLYQVSPGGHESCLFALLSVLLYVLVYTPLKRISSISIFVGSFPGAIPILLGWVAATNDFGLAAGILFAIQFCWQFPHFISIAWVLEEDYKKAGFKMMYGGEKGRYPATIALLTSILMTIISTLPYFLEINYLSLSLYSFIATFTLGLWFTIRALKLYIYVSDKYAKKLMLGSFIYLPLIQVIYILDKYLIQ